MLLTGGGKDRKIILWDHDLNPEREIEVRMKQHEDFKILSPLNAYLSFHMKLTHFPGKVVHVFIISKKGPFI